MVNQPENRDDCTNMKLKMHCKTSGKVSESVELCCLRLSHYAHTQFSTEGVMRAWVGIVTQKTFL